MRYLDQKESKYYEHFMVEVTIEVPIENSNTDIISVKI